MLCVDHKQATERLAHGRLALEDPNFRTEAQLKQIRSFRDAAQQMLQRDDRQVSGPAVAASSLQPHSAGYPAAALQRACMPCNGGCLYQTK